MSVVFSFFYSFYGLRSEINADDDDDIRLKAIDDVALLIGTHRVRRRPIILPTTVQLGLGLLQYFHCTGIPMHSYARRILQNFIFIILLTRLNSNKKYVLWNMVSAP